MVRGTIGDNSRPLNHYPLGNVKSQYGEFSIAVDSLRCPDYTRITYGGILPGKDSVRLKEGTGRVSSLGAKPV